MEKDIFDIEFLVETFGKRTNCRCRFHIYKRVHLHRDLSYLIHLNKDYQFNSYVQIQLNVIWFWFN